MKVIPLPISALDKDPVPVTDGVIVLGSCRESELATLAATDDPHHAVIVMNDDPECDLWLQVPYAVAALGCAAPNASTIGMLFDARDREIAELTDVMRKVRFIRFATDCWERRERRRSSLGPDGSRRLSAWLKRGIAATTHTLPGEIAERTAVAAGLHLLYDDLDGSHALSQTIEGRGKNHNGDYWHAIMHRREPDYSNARYWFRRVGTHPVMNELPTVMERVCREMPRILPDEWTSRIVKNGRWDSLAFVDACEEACSKPADEPLRRVVEEIQHFEMLHLLVQSCADAAA